MRKRRLASALLSVLAVVLVRVVNRSSDRDEFYLESDEQSVEYRLLGD